MSARNLPILLALPLLLLGCGDDRDRGRGPGPTDGGGVDAPGDAGAGDGAVPDAGPCTEGAPCDDGDPCTAGDTCAAGVCAGSPRVCDTPDEPTCVGDALRVHDPTGECVDGECRYDSTDTPCPAGCAAGSCICAPGEWASETVASDGDTGHHADVTTDEAGAVHISHANDTSGDLMHVTDADGSWVQQRLVGGSVTSATSITTDATGTLHVAASVGTALWHAMSSPTGWTAGSIDGSNSFGSAIASAGGDLAIAYFKGPSVDEGDLWIARRPDGDTSWTTELVDSDDEIATSGIATAFEPAGPLHVTYQVQSLGAARYARSTGAGWTIETLPGDALGGLGGAAGIAVAGDGRVHACYSLRLDYDLYHAVRAPSGGWTQTLVAGDSVTQCAIAIDGHGEVHILYRDPDLHHATPDGAGGFDDQLVSPADTQKSLGLHVDEDEGLHATWGSRGNLRYAYRSGCP